MQWIIQNESVIRNVGKAIGSELNNGIMLVFVDWILELFRRNTYLYIVVCHLTGTAYPLFVTGVHLTQSELFIFLRFMAFGYPIYIFKRALNMRQSRVRNPFQPWSGMLDYLIGLVSVRFYCDTIAWSLHLTNRGTGRREKDLVPIWLSIEMHVHQT
jgi:hypothetical protein